MTDVQNGCQHVSQALLVELALGEVHLRVGLHKPKTETNKTVR